MSYASVQNLIARYDARTVGQLVSDNNIAVPPIELAWNSVAQAALDDASGEIEAALLRGERYSAADLAALTGNSAKHLIRICCDIAFWNLWDRRPWQRQDPGRDDARKRSQDHLDRLAKGENVFNIAAVLDAGLPESTGPSAVELSNLNLIAYRARGHFYPVARLPNNR